MKNLKLIALAALVAFGTILYGQSKQVDVEKSSLHWLGKKVTGEHDGYISLKKGMLEFKNGNIVGGSFIIDMGSITNTDIESDEYKAKLIGHLKSDDFFGVETYPTANLVITEATAFKKGEAKVKGKLSIKKDTHPVEFTVKQSGSEYAATIVVDRSKYDVRYGSKSFFDNLGDKAIHDEFTLTVKIVTK